MKINQRVKVEFYDGFHGAQFVAVVMGIVTYIGTDSAGHKFARIALSESAIKTADSKICGMSDCMCGGTARAKARLIAGDKELYCIGEREYTTSAQDYREF